MAAFVAVELAPLALLAIGPGWFRALAAAAALVQWAVNVAIMRETCGVWAPALLWPLGTVLLAFGVLRATWLAVIRRGVDWRGTFYSLAELEAGAASRSRADSLLARRPASDRELPRPTTTALPPTSTPVTPSAPPVALANSVLGRPISAPCDISISSPQAMRP